MAQFFDVDLGVAREGFSGMARPVESLATTCACLTCRFLSRFGQAYRSKSRFTRHPEHIPQAASKHCVLEFVIVGMRPNCGHGQSTPKPKAAIIIGIVVIVSTIGITVIIPFIRLLIVVSTVTIVIIIIIHCYCRAPNQVLVTTETCRSERKGARSLPHGRLCAFHP